MKLIAYLRLMQLYAHIAHNVLGGKTFFQDHEFLAEIYQAYEGHYDAVVERLIGLGKKIDLVKVHTEVCKSLEEPKSYDECFKYLLEAEQELCQMIESEKGLSEGTRQLLGDIASLSEVRQYKLKQRLL